MKTIPAANDNTKTPDYIKELADVEWYALLMVVGSIGVACMALLDYFLNW